MFWITPFAISSFKQGCCHLQGATFVSYQPEHGEWRFDVEHFSRYGLIDADSDDEELQADQADSAEQRPRPAEDEGSIAMLEGEHFDESLQA
jgi:Nucleoporin autopeptidase